MSGRARAVWPWLAAAFGAALTLAWFYPGYATADTQAQFQQAVSGRYDDVHPPLLAWMWRGLFAFGDGTAPMFVALTAGFWAGLVRVLRASCVPPIAAAVATLATGLWPALLVLESTVWKDTALIVVLLHAAASAIALEHAAPGRGPRHVVAALALLIVAAALRHNAWPALLPLAWLLAARGRSFAARTARFATLALVLALAPGAIARALDAETRYVWTTLPVFDLGALSAATGERLLPPEIAPSLTPELARAFHRPWSNTQLVASGQVRISFFYPYGESLRRALVRAWLAAIVEHPESYVRHRYAVIERLAFGIGADVPGELVRDTTQRIAAGAVPHAPPPWVDSAIAAVQRSAVFGAAPYLAVATIAWLWCAWRARPRCAAAAALLASAWLYFLPLAAVAVASEFRYVGWTVAAALVATVVSLCSSSRIDASRSLAPVPAAE